MDTPVETGVLREAVDIPFEDRVSLLGMWPIVACKPRVLQMNLGYVCNQMCAHCHLEAGPDRTEMMSDKIMRRCLDFAGDDDVTEFDLTGGAPELHPKFRWLVKEIRKRGCSVIDRCNLTILYEPGQEGLGEFLAENGVQITSSLPHYDEKTTDSVRGKSVFEKSIRALKLLNSLGYGKPESGLELMIVHNPSGAITPQNQQSLEKDYRTQLEDRYGIVFNKLITITNMPLGRFYKFLEGSGNLIGYMRNLEGMFNKSTLECVMCRFTISVRWDGTLFDCDFNQCLDLAIGNEIRKNIRYISLEELAGRVIRCMSHCYGCTAGQGSSCGGAISVCSS